MIILLHVSIALFSIAFTVFSIFTPSKKKIQVSYSLVVATLASGFYLVASTGSPILQSCVTGLIYLGIVMSGIVVIHRKLAHVTAE